MATYINEKILTQMVVDYEPPEANYIADSLLTSVKVNEFSGKYAIFQKYASKPSDDIVGYKSSSPELDTARIPTKGTYATEEHAHKELVIDKDADTYTDYFDMAKESAYAIKKQLLLNKEVIVAALVAAGSYSDTPSVKWDATSGTIIIEKDIRNGITAFKDQCGIAPNTVVIPDNVWEALSMDSTLRDLWKLVPGRKDQNIKLTSLIPMLFPELTNVLVPDSKYDTTLKNLTESLTRIWTDTVSLIYTVPKGTKKTFTWASKFIKTPIQSKIWENPDKDVPGNWVKILYEEDRKQTCATAIYNLTDVLT